MNFDSTISIGDIIQLIAVISAFITIIVIVIWNSKQYNQMNKQLDLQNEQMKNQFFSEYTKRYQEIILNFPENINDNNFSFKDLSKDDYDKTMRYMRIYFDLCSEEYFLHKKKHLDDDVWNEWKDGMIFAFNKTAFKEAWEIVTEDSDFYKEFKSFINNKIISVKENNI